VGQTVADKLARHFRNIDKLANASLDELLGAPEVGEKIAKSVFEFFRKEENRHEIARLKKAGLNLESAHKAPEKESDVLAGKSFLVSGVFTNYQRDELKEVILRNGGKLLSSVTGKLDYLVAGDNMGPAQKEKAESLGVAIISESEFQKMLKKSS
jgi:DNA ligase (NAD+)